MEPQSEGGCFCGRIRYRVIGAPIDAGYCHCRMCQRASGAPVVAWGTWDAAAFAWLGAEPATLRSSVPAVRRFCAACGTHLLFRTEEEPEEVDVSLATLDRPELVAPEYHIWNASRITWFETADALPRHADAGRDDRQHRSQLVPR
jgi:hypothetical protein